MHNDTPIKPSVKTRPKIEDSRLAYTVAEAASLLGTGYHTLWRRIKLGDIHTIRGMGNMRIAKSELERFLANKAEYTVRKRFVQPETKETA